MNDRAANTDEVDVRHTAGRSQAATSTGRAASGQGVVLALGAVVFTFAFQQTAVLPAIPTIEHALGASTVWSAWLLSGYLMVATVTTPVLGRLADLRGEAKLLFASMGVFFAGSVGAAVLPGLQALIVCRAAQGAGGAIFPLTFAIARRHLDDEKAKLAIAGLTGAFGVGSVVGFATGGWMTQEVSWRLVFGIGAACVAVSALVLRHVVPRGRGTAEGQMDWGGGAWLGATSLSALVAVTLGPQTGWASPAPVALFVATAGCAAMWVRTELHHPQPLIDLRVLKDRTVLFVNGTTAALGWGRFVGLLVVPLLVAGGSHGGLGADATVVGAVLVPDGCGTTIGGPAAGVLARRTRPNVVLTAAMLVIATGAVVIAAGTGSWLHIAAGAGLLGLGGGAATQATSAVTTADVPEGTTAASSALNSTVRRLAGGIGGQASVAILAATAGARGTAGGLPPTRGFVIVFALAAALAGGGALLAALAPSR